MIAHTEEQGVGFSSYTKSAMIFSAGAWAEAVDMAVGLDAAESGGIVELPGDPADAYAVHENSCDASTAARLVTPKSSHADVDFDVIAATSHNEYGTYADASRAVVKIRAHDAYYASLFAERAVDAARAAEDTGAHDAAIASYYAQSATEAADYARSVVIAIARQSATYYGNATTDDFTDAVTESLCEAEAFVSEVERAT